MEYFKSKDAILFGWNSVKERISFFALISFVLMCVSLLFSNASTNASSVFSSAVFDIAQVVFGTILGMGFIYIAIRVVRKESYAISDLLTSAPVFWKYLGASIVYMLIVFLGLILLIVPGLIWMARFSLYKYIIVDKKDITIRQAMRESAVMTKGVIGKLILFTLLIILLNLAGFVFFIIGLLVTIPVSVIAFAYVYEKLMVRLEPVVQN